MNNDKLINLPEKLFSALSSHLQRTSFKSVEDFVVYILQDYLDQQKSETMNEQQSGDDVSVLKRLEDLGYM